MGLGYCEGGRTAGETNCIVIPAADFTHKVCFGCERFLPLSAYSKDRHHSTKIASRCKDCRNKYNRGYRQRQRENNP